MTQGNFFVPTWFAYSPSALLLHTAMAQAISDGVSRLGSFTVTPQPLSSRE